MKQFPAFTFTIVRRGNTDGKDYLYFTVKAPNKGEAWEKILKVDFYNKGSILRIELFHETYILENEE